MSDLINRQTAINTLLKAYPLMQKEKLVEVMNGVPAEASEIVRCKDCNCSRPSVYEEDEYIYCPRFGDDFERWFYCGFAERKNDE